MTSVMNSRVMARWWAQRSPTSGTARGARERARPADATVIGVLFVVAYERDGAVLVVLIVQRDGGAEEGAGRSGCPPRHCMRLPWLSQWKTTPAQPLIAPWPARRE